MKDKGYAKKLAYMGAGCGVVLFGVFGLLPGSFLGGVMGLIIMFLFQNPDILIRNESGRDFHRSP